MSDLRCSVCWTADHSSTTPAITIQYGFALCAPHGFISNEQQFWLEIAKARRAANE